jgi:serine/threonine-protein kinase
MGLLDKFQNLFTDKRTDLAERFEIVREAVHGTMSNFHMAIDRRNKRTIGLKILDSEKTAAFEARFPGLKKPWEGAIALKLKHPRIVETYEADKAKDGRQFIVMEFIEGTGLNVLLNNRDKRIEGNRHVLVKQMAEAIDAVHKAGFIHRDVCPRNFIASPDATSLKLIDFGLTLPAEPPYMLPGNRTGTPLYLAPEIVRRKNTDQRVDIFAYGVTCYQLCTFEFPWPSSDTTGRGALQHDNLAPIPILTKRPDLNPVLAKVIMHCMMPDPNARPADMEAVLKSLKAVPDEEGK